MDNMMDIMDYLSVALMVNESNENIIHVIKTISYFKYIFY